MEQRKQVGIWIRVSTEDAAKGDSPEHHEKRARLFAESKGWNVVTVYHLEGLTGKSVMGYAETKRMLDDIRNAEITGLIFSKLARFARNTKELLEFADIFQAEDAALISLEEAIDTSTPAGRLFYTMIAAMAQWDREEIVSRVVASIPIRAKMGKHIGGHPSLGYKWVGKEFVIDEEFAPVRKLVYELFLKHKRKKAVAKALNEQGYRTRGSKNVPGKKFTDTTVTRLLRDPTAKGERRLNFTDSMGGKKNYTIKPVSEWTTVTCPAIVSAEVWDQCNHILDQTERKRTKLGPQTKTLLAGYVECENCQKKMYVYHSTQTPSYTCSKCKTRIHVDDLDFIFKDELRVFLLTDTPISRYLETIDVQLQEKETLLLSVRDERQKMKKRMEEMVNMRVAGEWNRETFVEHFKPMEERMMQIDNQLPAVEAEIDFMKIQRRSADEVLYEAKDLHRRWDNMEFEDKRNVVEIITDVITVGKTEVSIELSYIPIKSPRAANAALPTASNQKTTSTTNNQNPVKRQSEL